MEAFDTMIIRGNFLPSFTEKAYKGANMLRVVHHVTVLEPQRSSWLKEFYVRYKRLPKTPVWKLS